MSKLTETAPFIHTHEAVYLHLFKELTWTWANAQIRKRLGNQREHLKHKQQHLFLERMTQGNVQTSLWKILFNHKIVLMRTVHAEDTVIFKCHYWCFRQHKPHKHHLCKATANLCCGLLVVLLIHQLLV